MKTFKIIDCKNYIYIKADGSVFWNDCNSYLFDRVEAQPTNKLGWFKLDKIPKVVSRKKLEERINERYELKTGYTPSDMMPQIIQKDQFDEFEEVIGLYTYKYDTVPGGYEDIEFSIDKIYEREDFAFVPNKYDAETDLITQIEYPEVAHQDKPCKIDSSQMLQIIRKYVKKHIDTSVAEITSDYDFHFQVVKKIALAEPYNITVDANNSCGNKRRKPKWINRMISSKEVTIVEYAEKPYEYKGSTYAPSIVGENYIDLQNKVEKFLSELMEQINKKYCECPTCKGWGVVEE